MTKRKNTQVAITAMRDQIGATELPSDDSLFHISVLTMRTAICSTELCMYPACFRNRHPLLGQMRICRTWGPDT